MKVSYLLPDKFIKAFAEARAALDFMLVISLLSGSFAVAGGSYLLYVRAPILFLISISIGLFIAWSAYKGAISSAVLYAQQIKVAFDLYRNDLLKQMHIPLPATPEEENMIWADIALFIFRNWREKPHLWKYTNATPRVQSEKKQI